jgi:putative membrane protein
MNTASVLLAHGGWSGPGPWVLFVPFLWAIAVFGVVTTVRRVTGRGRGPGGPWARRDMAGSGTAFDILARRFAEGQIDENEYWLRLSVLNETRNSVAEHGAG